MRDKADILIDEVIEAHGGRALWESIDAIEADLSADGFLFAAKHRPALKHVAVRAEAHKPHFQFLDFPSPGITSELLGDEEARICGKDGNVIESRTRPRAAFKGLRRNLWWDALDFIYFGGYATWNYFVTPFIFMRPGFTFEYLGKPDTPEGAYSCLCATFPQDLPTHSRSQTFFFDDQKLMRRLDYTAEVVGGWAHAAHLCHDYKDFSGLKVPVRRRVTPIILNRRMKAPTLVAIDIHDVSIKFR